MTTIGATWVSLPTSSKPHMICNREFFRPSAQFWRKSNQTENAARENCECRKFLARSVGRFSESQRLHDRVVKGRAHLSHFLIIARGIYAIGEQHNEKFAVWINPYRSAGKPGVAKTMGREKMTAGAAFCGYGPA